MESKIWVCDDFMTKEEEDSTPMTMAERESILHNAGKSFNINNVLDLFSLK